MKGTTLVRDSDEVANNGGENGQRVDMRWKVVWSCINWKEGEMSLNYSLHKFIRDTIHPNCKMVEEDEGDNGGRRW